MSCSFGLRTYRVTIILPSRKTREIRKNSFFFLFSFYIFFFPFFISAERKSVGKNFGRGKFFFSIFFFKRSL